MEVKKEIRILTLDGGGSKGVYTLGVLSELEQAFGCRIYEKFDLIYGTSTGAIIAALLGLGMSVEEARKHYFELVPQIMGCSSSKMKSAALEKFANNIFGDLHFESLTLRIFINKKRF